MWNRELVKDTKICWIMLSKSRIVNRMDRALNKYRTVFICLLLIVATAVAFERLRCNVFVFDEALGEYQKILRAEPDDYKAFNGLGVAFVRQGRLAEAAAYFNKALKIKPDYAEARENLNYVLKRSPAAGRENKQSRTYIDALPE